MQKSPNLIPELRQRLIIRKGEFFHAPIVSCSDNPFHLYRITTYSTILSGLSEARILRARRLLSGVTGDFSSVSLRSRRRPSLAPALPFRILSPHRTGGLPVIPRYTRPEMARIWSDEN